MDDSCQAENESDTEAEHIDREQVSAAVEKLKQADHISQEELVAKPGTSCPCIQTNADSSKRNAAKTFVRS